MTADLSAAARILQSSLTSAVAAELTVATALRHDLHCQPDLSGAESATAAAVATAMGFPDAPEVAGTGRLIRIGPASGPCIAIRAELDALPVPERSTAPWASENGAMHACGHDVHLAALTALGRAARQAELPVALLAVLQPREEAAPSGALDIATSAEFAANEPAAVIGVHLQHQLPAGSVAAAAGTINAATDDFEITVRGPGGHAGYPHLAADPILALCQSVVTLQHLISRRIDPTHAAVLSVGTLQAGHAPNVIPATATAHGTIRTLDTRDRQLLRAAVGEVVADVCRAHGCEGTVTVVPAEPALVNDPDLTAACQTLLGDAGFVVDTEFRSCGADDFSYYGRAAPSVMLFAGSGTPVSLHHPEFLPADDRIGDVANVMVAGYFAALTALQS
ncbi:MAG TPA: M20 family metallopeptidase [Streptosporangiaceae bacterium]|nr:M20 family metallopeptidase [Streptosporangiaceae bacterium]